MLNQDISDIHLCATESLLHESVIFPGPRKVDASELAYAEDLLGRCKVLSGKKLDFMVFLGGEFFRGRQDNCAVDGVWYRLRRMPPTPPTLDSLPSSITSAVKKMLMSPLLQSGGLIYIVGAPGQGKTTTASGLLISRLRSFGGFAYTMEDPPEMPLNGWHQAGYCSQTWVAGDANADWAEAFRGALRSQPAGTPTILYVGEVRDQDSALAILRAASSGFLVVATGFGTDIVSSIDELVRRAGGGDESVLMSLASVVRLVLHQRLVDDRLIVQFLASANSRTTVAAKIRSGSLNQLISEIQFQSNQALLGVDVLNDQMKGG
jgi:Tfp pilus assembly pilus retraction ATPase PilT